MIIKEDIIFILLFYCYFISSWVILSLYTKRITHLFIVNYVHLRSLRSFHSSFTFRVIYYISHLSLTYCYSTCLLLLSSRRFIDYYLFNELLSFYIMIITHLLVVNYVHSISITFTYIYLIVIISLWDDDIFICCYLLFTYIYFINE